MQQCAKRKVSFKREKNTVSMQRSECKKTVTVRSASVRRASFHSVHTNEGDVLGAIWGKCKKKTSSCSN